MAGRAAGGPHIDESFAYLVAQNSLPQPAAHGLAEHGFVILAGPIPPMELSHLQAAYHAPRSLGPSRRAAEPPSRAGGATWLGLAETT